MTVALVAVALILAMAWGFVMGDELGWWGMVPALLGGAFMGHLLGRAIR